MHKARLPEEAVPITHCSRGAVLSGLNEIKRDQGASSAGALGRLGLPAALYFRWLAKINAATTDSLYLSLCSPLVASWRAHPRPSYAPSNLTQR